MNNVWLIARREYLERVRAKSFLVMTVLIPLIDGRADLWVGADEWRGGKELAYCGGDK